MFSKKNKVSIVESGVLTSEEDLLKALRSGETITKEQALSIPAVASAVDLIAGTIATIPVRLYRKQRDENGRTTVTEERDIRCMMLNDDPQDTLDGVQLKKAMVSDYLLDTGGYAYIDRVGNRLRSIRYVQASNISITANDDPIFKKYSIYINAKRYFPWQFLKLIRNTKDGSRGESVRVEISKALMTAYENLVMQYASAKKGGKKRGFLKTKTAMSKTALTELKDNWESLYSNDGINSIVLPNGAEFQESNDSTFEQSVNTTRKQLNDEINEIFHIGKDYNEFYRKALYPILCNFRATINRELLLEVEKEKGYFFDFDTYEVEKMGLKDRFESYEIGIRSGIMTPNECRLRENLNAIDGLDVINFGLGASLYDINKKLFYTPNTDSEKKIGSKEKTE